MQRSVLVRHLSMPGMADDSAPITRFLATLSLEATINLMTQYYPAGKVSATRYPALNRCVTPGELMPVQEAAGGAGLRRFV